MVLFKTIIILGILLAIGFYAFLWAEESKTKETLTFLGFMVLLFSVVYAVSILNFKIGGAVNIEKTKQEIYAAKKDIEEISNAIMEISFILADGSARFGGMQQEHLNEIKQIYEKLPIPNKNIKTIEDVAKRKLDAIDKAIQERNRAN